MRRRMERIGMGLAGVGLAVVLATLATCSLSSTETPATSPAGGTGGTEVLVVVGTGGIGGAAGAPTDAVRCGTPVNVCAVSCGVDALAEARDGAAALTLQVCDQDGLKCPGNLVDINGCPRNSCARHHYYCCDPANGDVTLAPCQPDGTRGCPPGSIAGEYPQCIPPGLGVSDCYLLDRQPCAGDVHACHGGGTHCTCSSAGELLGMVWACQTDPPIP